MQKNSIQFSIEKCTAWLDDIEWRKIASYTVFADSVSTIKPCLEWMPVMLRRRANFLGKIALDVAYRCIGDYQNIPMVFCSRHGEVARSVDMLFNLAEDKPVSPTAFSLSVHNGVAGLFSIARADKANTIAIAGGPESVEHALIEACGLLHDGASHVLLVVYDAVLPDAYRPFGDPNDQLFAWAWLLTPPKDHYISLCWQPADMHSSHETLSSLPHGLEVLWFYLKQQHILTYRSPHCYWEWFNHV